MESTTKSYISNSYQGNLNFYRHKIPYTLPNKKEGVFQCPHLSKVFSNSKFFRLPKQFRF